MGKVAATGTRGEAKERLMVEAAQKDPSRFGELYELHFERVYAYIARRVRDRDAAEDLTSEVFHRALSSLPRFDWRGIPFAVWLLRIASNLIVDRWKRVAREVVEDPPEQVIEMCPVEVEHRARLFRMVELLPEDQRRVVVLRFAEEKSIREIAHEIGRSEGAVKQLQFRGLQTLRSKLGAEYA
jgi:RNA polymerase sigma-70 factor (ECF subfamily)